MNTHYGTTYRLGSERIFQEYKRDFIIEPTKDSPFVRYSSSENVLMIKGKSLCSELDEVYDTVLDSIYNHLEEKRELRVVIYLTAINECTLRAMFCLFKIIRNANRQEQYIRITWCNNMEDFELERLGVDFAQLYNLDFEFLTI